MNNDEKNANIEQMIVKLKAYIDQLNMALQNGCRDEMCKAKKEYKEIISLAGELDDCLKW